MLDADESVHTTMCILADKEEIGSEGVSGMQCSLIVDLLAEFAHALGGNAAAVRAASRCLSSDVAATYDPNFDDVYEKRNAALINAALPCANSPVRAERAAPPMLPPSWSAGCAAV